jgi:hypothetical protein
VQKQTTEESVELGDYVVYVPSSEDRIEDLKVDYFLPLSIGRVVRLSDWPPVANSIATVHWMYSADEDGAVWNTVSFIEWEIEQEWNDGCEIVHHHGEVSLDRFVHVDGKILTVDFHFRRQRYYPTFESSALLESIVLQDQHSVVL